jgi:SAM-dependent methyltransferase
VSAAEFDAVADEYEALVTRSTAFGLAGHDVYTKRKAASILDIARRLLDEPSNLKALDVGCGVGLTDRYLVEQFGELHGTDPSGAAVARAMATNEAVQYQVLDGAVLPYGDWEFDFAFAICVVHHVDPEEWKEFASELRRVVRPGGVVAVFEHNPLHPLTRLSVRRCPFDADAVLLSRRRAARLLASAGLVVAEQRYIMFLPSSASSVQAAERAMGWAPFGAQYYVAGRRSGPVLNDWPLFSSSR